MRNYFFQLFILLICIEGSTRLYGQSCTFTLKGSVLDLHDDTPIFGALLTIEGTTFFSQTDEKGNYQIKGLCPGSFVLQVEHPECESIKRKINIRANQVLNFELEHHINELEEIIISDSKLKQISNSLIESRLDSDQITQFSSKSLADALSTLSGVSALRTGNSIAKPVIHGMFGSRVGIVANGIRLRDQEWGADHAPNIDLNAFENIQLVKGAATLKYGGDIAGGIIVLTPSRRALKDSLYGGTTLNIENNGRGGSFSTRLVKTNLNGYYLSGDFTAKRFGDFQAPMYNLSNTGLQEGNFSFKIGRTKIVKGWEFNYSRYQNEAGILRAAHIGNVQDLFTAIQSDVPLRIKPFTYALTPPKQQANHQNVQFTYFKTLKNKAKWEWNYNYQINQRKEFDIRRGSRSEIPAIDLKLQTHAITTNYRWKKNFNWQYELGISGLLEDNFSNPKTGIKRLIPDYLKYELGMFILGTYQPNNNISLDWGLRLDGIHLDAQKYYDLADWRDRGYDQKFSEFEVLNLGTQLLTNPQLNFFNIAAQIGMTTSISPELKTSFTYAISQRAPNASELFSDGLHHSLATIEYGNLSLQKETTHKVLAGLLKSGSKHHISIAPYISFTNHYIFIAPVGLDQTIRGAFPVWEYNATDALLFGMDFNANFDLTQQLAYKLSSSYTYGQDILFGQPLISIPPFNTLQKIKYTALNKFWDLELAHNFVAKQIRFPNNNFVFNTIEMGTIMPKNVDISTPPDAFHKLDLIFSLYLKRVNNFNCHFRFMVQNVLNADYRDYLNRMRFYAAEIGRNFQIQVKLKY